MLSDINQFPLYFKRINTEIYKWTSLFNETVCGIKNKYVGPFNFSLKYNENPELVTYEINYNEVGRI